MFVPLVMMIKSIYSFRGSDPSYLLEFEKDFPHAEMVTLDQNYRSSHEIVAAANQMIVQNKKRRPKKMNAQFMNDKLQCLFFPDNEEEEATMIVTDIQEKITNGANPADFAILFRTNAVRGLFLNDWLIRTFPLRLIRIQNLFMNAILSKVCFRF